MELPSLADELFVGCVEPGDRIRDAFSTGDRLPLATSAEAGSWIRFRVEGGRAVAAGPILAAAGGALADLYALAAKRGLSPLHPPAVMAETAAAVADPGIDDPRLEDLTRLPFVTIDEVHSRDLDQALFIERRRAGFTVWYAIADPAWCVRPGSALFEEALTRGATYYLPGLVIPMLPRELSEGTVSLNPRVDRRAMVFEVELDGGGRVEQTRIHRARVRSRVKTSYDAVQAWYDGDAALPGGETAASSARIAASLELLAEVGARRIALAEARGVVAFRRGEIAVSLGPGRDAGAEPMRFVALADPRNDVERYNEQISLLCNVEGARFLMRDDREDDDVQPIYRVHDPPDPHRLEELSRQIGALVRRHRLDAERWDWRPGGRSLAEYLRSLPSTGSQERLARSIHRQAMLTGGRSLYATVPGMHFGVGADVYGRFTAPMREIVGIFAHKEAWEKLEGRPRHGHRPEPEAPDDELLREQVVKAANAARQTQRELDREVNRRVLDQLFGDDLGASLERRPRRRGTVMGVSRSKVHVALDEPPIDVKVYIHHLSRRLGRRLAQGRDRVTLREADGTRRVTVGDEVTVRVTGRDHGRDRWELELAPDAALPAHLR